MSDLKYFDQKLAKKSLNGQILVRFGSSWLRRVLEERTRQPTQGSWFIGSVTHRRSLEPVFGIYNPLPTVGALGSVGFVLIWGRTRLKFFYVIPPPPPPKKMKSNKKIFYLIRLKVCYVDNFHYWDDSSDQNGNDFRFWGTNIGATKK